MMQKALGVHFVVAFLITFQSVSAATLAADPAPADPARDPVDMAAVPGLAKAAPTALDLPGLPMTALLLTLATLGLMLLARRGTTAG